MDDNMFDERLRDHDMRQAKMEHLLAKVEGRSRHYLRFGILFSTMFITIVAAVLTFYQEGVRRAELNHLWLDEVTSQTKELRMSAAQTEALANEVMGELERQRQRLADLTVSSGADIRTDVELSLASLGAQLASLETDVAAIQSANVVGKLAAIEDTLQGDVTKLLSVPLLRSQLDNYRALTETERFRLERDIKRLDSRLDFFVTATITLAAAFLTAVIGPFMISFIQRRKLGLSDSASATIDDTHPAP